MARRIGERIELETGSGNVFADLGLPDAEKLKIKSGMVIEITRAVRALGLTQEEAGRRMGIPQPKVSALLRGDFANLSERKLMDCLNRLDVLLREAGRVVTRDELAKIALGRMFSPYDRSIDMHISKLRKKLGEDGKGGERIKTVRG